MTSENSVLLRGEIKHPAGAQAGNLMVELEDGTLHHSQKTGVSSAGDFEFDQIPMGTYLIRVTTMAGTPVCEKFVEVRQGDNWVDLELPKDDSQKPGTGTVSLAQLLHRVTGKAMKEYNTGLSLLHKKKLDDGIAHLEKAVEIDPQFVEAQTDLGRAYLVKHEPEKVLAAFQQVLKVNPQSEVAYSGSSVALLWLRRFPDAEDSARRALAIDSGSQASHYWLAMSLLAQNKDADEALTNLNQSATSFPTAHITAAKVLVQEGKMGAAKTELQDYLKTGVAEHRDEVKSWLKQMTEH